MKEYEIRPRKEITINIYVGKDCYKIWVWNKLARTNWGDLVNVRYVKAAIASVMIKFYVSAQRVFGDVINT